MHKTGSIECYVPMDDDDLCWPKAGLDMLLCQYLFDGKEKSVVAADASQ